MLAISLERNNIKYMLLPILSTEEFLNSISCNHFIATIYRLQTCAIKRLIEIY